MKQLDYHIEKIFENDTFKTSYMRIHVLHLANKDLFDFAKTIEKLTHLSFDDRYPTDLNGNFPVELKNISEDDVSKYSKEHMYELIHKFEDDITSKISWKLFDANDLDKLIDEIAEHKQ